MKYTPTHATVVAALRTSRGWLRRISRDTGQSYYTLSRMVKEDSYIPRVSVVESVGGWFVEHGVPDCHPLAWVARQRRLAAGQAQ